MIFYSPELLVQQGYLCKGNFFSNILIYYGLFSMLNIAYITNNIAYLIITSKVGFTCTFSNFNKVLMLI